MTKKFQFIVNKPVFDIFCEINYTQNILRVINRRMHLTSVSVFCTSHTRTVVRECFKGDEASQWKRPKFDPSPHPNPLTDLHKN